MDGQQSRRYCGSDIRLRREKPHLPGIDNRARSDQDRELGMRDRQNKLDVMP